MLLGQPERNGLRQLGMCGYYTNSLLSIALVMTALPVVGQRVPGCSSQGLTDGPSMQRALQADDRRDLVRYMRVKVVIAAQDDGEGGLELAATPGRVQRDLDFANEVFDRCGTGIQFHLCAPPSVVVDPLLWNTSTGDGAPMIANREAGLITIFYVNFMSLGLEGGYANDFVLVAANARIHVLAHEFGHQFGLSHTDNLFNPELVDGSNCTTAGDQLCDTQADPGLIGAADVDPSSCTYIGNATDANGDVYDPPLTNIMSNSICLQDSITPQQGQLMRYIADNYWLSLRRTTVPITIDPFPTLLCANAAPLPLTASPGPGVFMGPLVVGNELVNAPNPAGGYHVSYTPDTPPIGPREQVDQLCIAGNPLPTAHTAYPTDSVRQTLRADEDAELRAIEVNLRATAAITYRLRFYAGVDADTTLWFDGTVNHTGTDTAWIRFDLPPGIMQASGDRFTIILTGDAPFAVMTPGSVYNEGTSNLGVYDVEFRTWVLGEAPCQTVTRLYDLYQVPDRPVLNLPDAACMDDAAAIPFLVDGRSVTSSQFLLDGDAATGLVPAALAVGDHLVQHIYTINSCTDTLEQSFTLSAPVVFNYAEIPSVVCTTDEALLLQASPPLGAFTIDGLPTALLDPQVLAPGTHVIGHLFDGALDTITFADQSCLPETFGINGFLAPDSVVWQSFVAQQTGDLEGIAMTVELYGLERTLVFQLREGEGPDGALLWQDTIATDVFPALFATGTGLIMEAGTTYTFALIPQAGGSDILYPTIQYMWTDVYTAGMGQVTGVSTPHDIIFREFITQRFACPVINELPLEVEVCSGIPEDGLTEVVLGPNPFTDLLTLRTGDSGIHYVLQAYDGRLVAQGSAAAHSVDPLTLPDLAAGSYVLHLWTADGRVAQRQVVRVR
jgi:hypothetical protein